MGGCGSCVFKAGYKVYADTCIGRYIHTNYIHRFRSKYGDRALHSRMTQYIFGSLVIIPIPVLSNNYTYLVADMESKSFVLIDVGDTAKVQLLTSDMKPLAILTTHKHWDHSHGNKEMRMSFPDIPIYGGERDNVPGATVTVCDGDVIKLGRLSFTAVWTPGHTKGHICYLLDGSPFNAPISMFTGDHIMVGGCGANFEGSILTMVQSLDKMTSYPDDTLVWPGHEIGLNNLLLAVFLEDDNLLARDKLAWAASQRINKLSTCPSTIGEEKQYNPFLRTHDEQFLRNLGLLSSGFNSGAEDCMACTSKGEDTSVACFREIIARATDSSEEAKKKRKEILDSIFDLFLSQGSPSECEDCSYDF